MLYFIFTIDGDWSEYFKTGLGTEERKPGRGMLSLIDQEIRLASSVLDGKFLHFVHTSPIVRDDFLKPEYVARWKEIEEKGGSIGVHCHEENLPHDFYFDDQEKMEKAIGFLCDGLNENGLDPIAYRGGYMAFSSKIIPILEENGIFLDFSCDPGRHFERGGRSVADWRGASDNYYRMSYDDHRKPGDSRVFEIPLGIYIEKESLFSILRKAGKLKRKKEIQIISVLAHTSDFKSCAVRLKIKLALLILKKYGRFINVEDALEIVSRR